MRGQRVSLKTNADGEIDENFWAQAAADQAAGRSGVDGNDGKSPTRSTKFWKPRDLSRSHLKMATTKRYRSTLNSSTMTLMMETAPDSTMVMMAGGSVLSLLEGRAMSLT